MSWEYLDDDDSNSTLSSVEYMGTLGKWKFFNDDEKEDVLTFESDLEVSSTEYTKDLFDIDEESNTPMYCAPRGFEEICDGLYEQKKVIYEIIVNNGSYHPHELIPNIEEDDRELKMIIEEHKDMIKDWDILDSRICKHKEAFHNSERITNKLALGKSTTSNIDKDLEAEWAKQDYHLEELHELVKICNRIRNKVHDNERKFNVLDKELEVYEAETRDYKEHTEIIYTLTEDEHKIKNEEKTNPKRKRSPDTVELMFSESIDDLRLSFLEEDDETQLPEGKEVEVAESICGEEAVLKKTRIHNKDGSVKTTIIADDLGDVVQHSNYMRTS